MKTFSNLREVEMLQSSSTGGELSDTARAAHSCVTKSVLPKGKSPSV